MNAIPTILKGDDTAAILLTLATGRTYTGATLVVTYQGVTRSFTGLTAGSTVSLSFTKAETATFELGTKPVSMRLVGSTGAEETVDNGEARIKVTDCVGEVNSGGSFAVTPGQQTSSVPITDVGDLDSSASISDLYDKVNELVRTVAQRTAAIALALIFAGVACAQSAKLGNLTPQSSVLTNAVVDLTPATNYTDQAITSAANEIQATLRTYVDSEIQGAGSVSPATVTNIVDAKITTATNAVAAAIPSASFIEDGTNTLYADGSTATQCAFGDVRGYWHVKDITHNAECYAMRSTEDDWWYGSMFGGADLPTAMSDDNIYIEEDNGSFYISYDENSGSITTSPQTLDLADETIVVTYISVPIPAARLATTNDVTEIAYPKTSGETLASQVSAIGTYLNAEDARFVSTNYNSTTRLPEAYVEIKQSNDWVRVWGEMTRWNAFAGTNFNWTTWGGFFGWKADLENSVSEKSPREYAFYDGVTGDVAPDGYFWIGQPHVAVCAGAAYQRYVDGANEIWVLESNGMVADINGTTNGYFRITDGEGDTQFEIVKGDKQTVFASAYALTMTNVNNVTHYYTTYAVTNAAAAPTAKFTASLTNQVWYADTDASCPCNVEWTAGANSYTLEWWPKASMPSMFVKAEYERGGETIIRNSAPVEMPTIIIGNTKYTVGTTTVNGETVMKLTPSN